MKGESEQKISIPSLPSEIEPILNYLFTPQGLIVLLCLLFLFFSNRGQNTKGKLANSRWANAAEIKAGRKLACKQIDRRVDEKFALYIGTPKESKIITEPDGRKILCLPEDSRTTYIPNAQGSVAYIGCPGSGKTYSAGDPLVMSALQQGFTVFYYDFKGHEDPSPSAKLIYFAKKHGYKVSVIDPNFEGTWCCNPLAFMKNEFDAETAREIAITLNDNLKLSGGNSNNFFSLAGNLLVQAILMLAKSSPYPDIVMCHKLLALENLGQRIVAAKNQLPQYLKVAFDQFLSAAKSVETASSIAATASLLYSTFMTPNLLRTFAGPNTLPLDVDGRHFIVFKSHPKFKGVFSPLMAATIQSMVNRNVYRPRRVPLVVSLDEISSIYIKPLVHWPNQNRSSKFAALLGIQSLGFLEDTYSKQEVEGILGGCSTQIVFQLNDERTAKYYSTILGETEVKTREKNKSVSEGKTSYSYVNQRHIRPLMSSDDFQHLLEGEAVIINKGNRNKKKARLPLRKQLVIPQQDVNDKKTSGRLWSKYQREMIQAGNSVEFTNNDIAIREVAAEKFLPDPTAKELAGAF